MTKQRLRRRGHHEGSSYQRPDGRWQWRETFPDGQRRSFYGKTEAAAKRKARRALKDYEDGLSRQSEKLTVKTYLLDWLETTASDRVRPSTLRSYRSHVETHIVPAIGHIQLRELNANDVNRMLAGIVNRKPTGKKRGTSPTTANRVRATLRTALTSAVKARLVRDNAAALSDPRREKPTKIEPLTADEARQLIEATRKDRMGPLIAVALATGMRQGELLALRWQDVDLEARVARVERTLTWEEAEEGDDRKMVPVFSDPKTEQSRRAVPLTQTAIDAFRRQREVLVELEQLATVSRWRPLPDEDLVFVSTVGTPMIDSNVTHRLQVLLDAAGLPRKRFHDLRHSTASFLLEQGVDLFTVKAILGHSQISQTADTYGHLTEKLAHDAADRLGRTFTDAKTDPSAPNNAPKPDNTIGDGTT